MTTGEGGPQSEVEVLPPGSPPVSVRLTDLQLLVGMWSGPAGVAGFSVTGDNQLVGHVVLTDDTGAPRLIEPWIFRAEPGGVRLLYKLFTADLKGLQEKDVWAHRWVVGRSENYLQLESMTLAISETTLDIIAIVNPQNQPPRRLVYSFRRVS